MKNVLITGASGDLGSAIAHKIASELKEDCLLILHYNKNFKKSEKLAFDLIKKYHCQTITIKADFCDLKEVDEMCKTILKKYKKVDFLINNSAMVLDADLEERTSEIFEKTLRCNLVVPFELSKQFGLKMNVNGGGKIINISSTNGIDYNSPYSIDYDASKAGLINLTKNFALALDKVNVNCVCPHWIDTQMNADLEPEYLIQENKKTLQGRFVKPEELAEFVWFLLSEKANYLTGQVYTYGTYKH